MAEGGEGFGGGWARGHGAGDGAEAFDFVRGLLQEIIQRLARMIFDIHAVNGTAFERHSQFFKDIHHFTLKMLLLLARGLLPVTAP